MRFPTGTSPANTTPPVTGEVKPASALRPSQRVEAHQPLPDNITYHPHHATPELPAITQQHQYVERRMQDRRQQARRISNQTVLIDLRSHEDRRHHNRRASDATTHVDDKV